MSHETLPELHERVKEQIRFVRRKIRKGEEVDLQAHLKAWESFYRRIGYIIEREKLNKTNVVRRRRK